MSAKTMQKNMSKKRAKNIVGEQSQSPHHIVSRPLDMNTREAFF